MAKRTNTVLIMRFSALGDVAMTIPVVYGVATANPESKFVFVTKKITAELFLNPPKNLFVEGIDLKSERYKGSAGMIHLFKDLRGKYNFDTFADLHSVIRSHIFGICCRFKGIIVSRIDKGRKEKKALVNHISFKPILSTAERYKTVFQKLGYVNIANFKTILTYGIDDNAYSIVSPPKQKRLKWIGIAPFAAHQGKIYPLDQMEKVVKELSSLSDVKIFLFGSGEKENSILKKWEDKYDSVTSLAKKRLGFKVELNLQARLDVMLSMDSANMHLASLVGTPVISIWGATHPNCGFSLQNEDEEKVIQLNLDCRPCSVYGNKPCKYGDYRCLTGINPQTIVSEIKKTLNII